MKRAREYGLSFGELPTGPRNKISDVPGVTVGHWTLSDETHRTGVTVVMPGEGNPFLSKPVAASFVLNGYGKTLGLMQIDELGTIETPIALTNTLNVGLVHNALVGWTLQRCRDEGVEVTSVNPVVAECNDAYLNDIADRAVLTEHVWGAFLRATPDFEEGCVGAGTGMACHNLKGGVGSASRILSFDGRSYTLGVLALTNHGHLDDFLLGGVNIGPSLSAARAELDKGSCILLLATDLPLDARQLRRVIKRMSVGLARLGSFIGPQSGEVMLGFSTANRVPDHAPTAFRTVEAFDENRIEPVMRAAAFAAEESVLNAMFAADTTTGYQGHTRRSLTELLDAMGETPWIKTK